MSKGGFVTFKMPPGGGPGERFLGSRRDAAACFVKKVAIWGRPDPAWAQWVTFSRLKGSIREVLLPQRGAHENSRSSPPRQEHDEESNSVFA